LVGVYHLANKHAQFYVNVTRSGNKRDSC